MDSRLHIPRLALWTGLVVACLIGIAATPHRAGAADGSGSHAQRRMVALSPTGPRHVDASVTDVPSCVSYLRKNTAGQVIQNYSDSDLQSICSGLLKPPANPNTFDTLASCVIDDITNTSFSNDAVVSDCRQKAGCSTRLPDALVEWLDGRVSAGCPVGGALSVSVQPDKSSFQVGESVSICYSVPGPGPVTLTDRQSGSSNILVSGADDGTGECLPGTISLPTGQECAHLDYTGPSGLSSSTDKCWTVTSGSTTTSQPPSGGTTTTTGSGSCSQWDVTGSWTLYLGAGGNAGPPPRVTLQLTQTGTNISGSVVTDADHPSGSSKAGTKITGTISGSSITLNLPWTPMVPFPPSATLQAFKGKISSSTSGSGQIEDTTASFGGWSATGPLNCAGASAASAGGSAGNSSNGSSTSGRTTGASTSGSGGSGGATTSSSSSTNSGGDSGCFDLFGIQVCLSP